MSTPVGMSSQILAHRRFGVWLPAAATSTAWLLPGIREERRFVHLAALVVDEWRWWRIAMPWPPLPEVRC
jgi:hypothetical protein